jgi:two-component system response regulator YesN
MYSVILVDDELFTLQGIRESFHWNEYNMEVIGAYNYATEALKVILEKKPDVVFTDIRMPIVSGIDIINAIRNHNLNTEVIIISGFGQFDYAQEAIRHGAFDYCLKPLDVEETDSLLEKLKAKLDQKLKEKKKKIIQMIMEEPEVVDPESYGLPNSYPCYQVVVWSGGNDDDNFQSFLQQREEVEYIEIVMSAKRYFIINCNVDLSNDIRQMNFSETIGLSFLYEAASYIPKMIFQAAVAATDYFITNQKNIYSYRAMQTAKITPFVVRATKLLDEGQLTEYNQLVKQIPQLFRDNQYSIEDLCFLWNRIIMHMELLYPDKFQKSVLSPLEWHQLEMEYEDIDNLCQVLIKDTKYIYGTSTADDYAADSQDSSNFSKILRYLNSHYNEQIKLKEISQIYYINKNYACYLFKRNTGMTYSEYLNKIRMEHAKKLLVSTEYSIFEISEMIGYVDYSYFSKAFKKTYGVTPSNYRKTPSELNNTSQL